MDGMDGGVGMGMNRGWSFMDGLGWKGWLASNATLFNGGTAFVDRFGGESRRRLTA